MLSLFEQRRFCVGLYDLCHVLCAAIIVLLISGCASVPIIPRPPEQAEWRWRIETPVNAMIYMYEQREGEGWSETFGGIGYSSDTPCFTVKKDIEYDVMCLQLPNGSTVRWGQECGTQFRPAYDPGIIPTGIARICLMRGFGKSKGWSLWIRVVEHPEESASQVSSEYLTGKWRTSANRGEVELLSDWTWKSRTDKNKTFSGAWIFRNNRITFTYDNFPPTYHETALVLDAADDTFLALEMNGTKTVFSRVK